ncbi:hypothetical protein [Helicobacter marmotae]|uniref:DUF115 domain-containing protein n=1 Tax=Helicobacter marmotae TaxID=152490 RepID=A0A3D8I1W9_9HELI|nr:hypothetical protein [Helicobacter marmotae]RDU59118.1 hypothetical protein CQA63_07935 [Helicobacter marmotae]
MSLKHFCLDFLHTAYSLYGFIRAKAFSSSVPTLAKQSNENIFILANGPSLKNDIKAHSALLSKYDSLMMNHAITESLSWQIKPKYYILMDSVFFVGDRYNVASREHYQRVEKEVKEVFNALENVPYHLELLVPNVWKHTLNLHNPNISIQTYGIAKFKGFDFIARYLFKHALALPSYCNVLIPSIICAIAMGYKRIYLLGCDHDWFRNYFVDSQNMLFNDYKHFYEESQTLCALEKLHLHHILYTDAEILHSYHILRELFLGVCICNLSSHSVIDAFPKSSLEQIFAGGGDRVKLLIFLVYAHFSQYRRAKC